MGFEFWGRVGWGRMVCPVCPVYSVLFYFFIYFILFYFILCVCVCVCLCLLFACNIFLKETCKCQTKSAVIRTLSELSRSSAVHFSLTLTPDSCDLDFNPSPSRLKNHT